MSRRTFSYGHIPATVAIPFSPPDETVSSLTPIARWDVVPWQRVASPLKAGIVAFSKEGVYGIEVAPSGAGYSGAATLTATSMTLNDRTDVWEYWVTIDPTDFSSDGAITLAATVYGDDGGRRTLDTITLYVDTGGLSQPEAWVTTGGSDTTGTVGNVSLPYASIAGALADIQSANSTCSGAVVYVGEGEFTLGNGSITSAGEWATVAAATGAAQANVIIHGQGSPGTLVDTAHLRFRGLTIRADGAPGWFLSGYPTETPLWLWVDTCSVVGPGRHLNNGCPIYRNEDWYCTDTSITDVDIAVRLATLVRNVSVEHIGDDCCFVCGMVINVTLHDQDPINPDGSPTYDHADGWQNGQRLMDNRICYGFHGTDMHVQGIFVRSYPATGTHTNNAFVNVLIENREPGRPGTVGGDPVLVGADLYGVYDHLLMWHCSITTERLGLFDETDVGFGITNSSFVGNLFHSFLDWVQADTNPVPYGQPGNTEGNDFLENHYIISYVDQGGSVLYSKSPDTDPDGSQTLGTPNIVTTLDAADYGTPNAGSPLLNRLSSILVPVDVLGNQRDSTPDVGAVERTS